jgi:hypothetical protein
MVKTTRNTWLALVPVAALVSGGAQAAGLDAFSSLNDPASINAPVYAGTSVTGFRVTLVDLAPDDGIAPGIVFKTPSFLNSTTGSAVYSDGTRSYLENDEIPGCCHTYPNQQYAAAPASMTGSSPWMPTQEVMVTSLDGVTSTAVGPTSLASVSVLGNSDLQAERITAPGDFWRVSANGVGLAGDSNAFQGGPMIAEITSYFELTPNTKAVFSGLGVGVAKVTSGAVEGLVPATVALSARTSASVQIASYVPVSVIDLMNSTDFVDPTTLPDYQGWVMNTLAESGSPFKVFNPETQQYEAASQAPGPVTSSKSEAFELAFVNSTLDAKRGVVSMYVTGVAEGTGTVVPEPASYALMGLGLIGISLVARRRQAAQA